MPVHIGQLETDVTVVAGDLPLSEQQIDRLIQLVVARLDLRDTEANRLMRDRAVRGSVLADLDDGESA